MKRTGLGLAIAGVASASFKLGKYSGHTSQRCQAGASGRPCSPGASFRIRFTVRRNPPTQILIIDLVWTEDDTCTGLPPGHEHSTTTQGPNDVRVSRTGRFSFTNSSSQARVHIQGSFSGKHASGTIKDTYDLRPGVTCTTGTVHWSAART
jgi:hypothetical protein